MPRLKLYFSRMGNLILVLTVLCACDDIPRDNPLDPKNPSSYRSQITLIEAFVNTNQALADSLPFNQFMLSALDQFESRHQDEIVIAEYHRGTFDDSLSRPEFNLRYEKYLAGLSSTFRSVPDVFVNGISARVTGASSAAAALTRLEKAFEPLQTAISEYTLEPDITKTGGMIKIEVTVAKLGDSDARDVVLRAILIEDLGAPYLRRVARQILNAEPVPSLPNGETKTVRLNSIPQKINSDRSLIITISSQDELEIFQSIEVGLDE